MSIGVAHTAALYAEPCFEVMQLLRGGTIDKQLPGRPSRDEWFSLYTDHRRVFSALMNCWPGVCGHADAGWALLDGSRALSTFVQQNPSESKALIESFGKRHLWKWLGMAIRGSQRAYKRHLEWLARELQDLGSTADETEFDVAVRTSIEVYFFARVT